MRARVAPARAACSRIADLSRIFLRSFRGREGRLICIIQSFQYRHFRPCGGARVKALAALLVLLAISAIFVDAQTITVDVSRS